MQRKPITNDIITDLFSEPKFDKKDEKANKFFFSENVHNLFLILMNKILKDNFFQVFKPTMLLCTQSSSSC